MWGRRQYPQIDLDLDWFLDHFLYDNSGISLSCTYGDPLCWPSLIELLEEKKYDTHCCMSINTFASSEVIFDAAEYRCDFIIDIDGIDDLCGKVFLGASWETIQQAISVLGSRAELVFHAFAHNRHQIPSVAGLAKKHNLMLRVVPGCLQNNPGASVISEKCEWLYDVIPENVYISSEDVNNLNKTISSYADCEPMQLEKTLWGFTSLRTYLPRVHNRSINNFPLVTPQKLPDDIEENIRKKFSLTDTFTITPDCKIFRNHALCSMYMHMLATDWSASASDIIATKDHIGSPLHDIVYCAQYFKEHADSIQQIP